MTRDQFLARLESLATAHIRAQEFEDCLCQRTQPGTPVGECSQNLVCGHQLADMYSAGYLQGARDAFEEVRGIVASWAENYPEDIFAPMPEYGTPEQKAQDNLLVTRASAHMGRHTSKCLAGFGSCGITEAMLTFKCGWMRMTIGTTWSPILRRFSAMTTTLRLGSELKPPPTRRAHREVRMGKMTMHKLRGQEAISLCSAWLRNKEGFWGAEFWRYVTCKRCLAKRPRPSSRSGRRRKK